MRLRNLPQETIVLTKTLIQDKNKQTFSLDALLRKAISEYNEQAGGGLSEDLADPQIGVMDEQDYLQQSFTIPAAVLAAPAVVPAVPAAGN